MRNQSRYLMLVTLLLAVYYLALGSYLNRLGYMSQEALFYIEKSKIILDGLGNRLKVMGLTSPILPFYASFVFSAIDDIMAPVIASAIFTSILFYVIASMLLTRLNDVFYLLVLLVIFGPVEIYYM